MSETASIYMWYVAPNKKYYLGVGSGKDPYYTHSAVSSEEFRDIVPHSQRPIKERKEFWDKYERGEIKGIRYRKLSKRLIDNFSEKLLLEDGTNYRKMCKLENKLLINRKNRCWDRYYNESLGNPRYVDLSGENHPMYKHGFWVGTRETKEKYNAAHREYRAKTPAYQKYQQEYHAEYHKENQDKILKYRKEYYLKNREEELKKQHERNAKLGKKEIRRRGRENYRKNREKELAKQKAFRSKNKAETGYTHGYSRAKNNTETQGEGTKYNSSDFP